ncbi:MAG: FtsX-like permease family protein, partial [Verrucomicrobia bacterium]|nr:FtsX-like permease family protein [Verrucomicrobiota bacterium]
VGLYLIFQALDAAVVRRRSEIAVLRALGVREWEIRRAWLWEAAFLGILGGTAGILGGWALAQFTVRAVSKTVNALYYANHAEAANLHWGEALGAFILSVICSIAAGWLPAKRAAATPPAQVWAQGAAAAPQGTGTGGSGTGWALLAAAVGLALLPPVSMDGGTRFALAGYVSALLGVVGAGLIAGDGLNFAAWCTGWFSRNSAALQLAGSHLRAPTSRHRWAVAGLLCAVSMTGGMAVLVGSFESSVSSWIGHTLQADLFLTSDANQAASAYNRIPAATWREIVQTPEVADWDTALIIPVELPGGQIRLVGSNLAFARRNQQLSWLQPPANESIFDASHNATLCLVSETFATRFRLHRNDWVSIPTPKGPRSLQICGVYTDFGDDQGLVLVDGRHLAEWFSTDAVSTLCLSLKPGADPEQLRGLLRAARPGIAVFTNAHLRSEVMRIFRQTFAITYALEAIGVIVALAGLGITLASILAERKAELTTLRALGMSRKEIAAVAAWEGTLLALAGTLGGLLCSFGLGALLIFVINKQTFGWTLQPSLPTAQLLLLGFCVPWCGAVVAWFVGRQISELPSETAR